MKVLSLLAASAIAAPAEIQAAARNETEPVKTPPGSAMVLYANSKKPHLKVSCTSKLTVKIIEKSRF